MLCVHAISNLCVWVNGRECEQESSVNMCGHGLVCVSNVKVRVSRREDV